MMSLIRKVFKQGVDHDEVVEEARLMNAERDLRVLQERAALATGGMEARHRRNHWQDAIDQLIRGARHV